MRWAAACVVVVALWSGGCRSLRAVPIAPEEHAAYKATRTRPTLEGRLHAAEEYLARYPRGELALDVRRSYLRAEEALWVSKKGSVVGLESYLAELPTGPHAKVARRELDARRAARVDLLGKGAAKTEVRLAAAAAARKRAREALGDWLGRFADASIYTGTMTDAPSATVVPWSLTLPQPKCASDETGGRRCTKLVAETFEIPRQGERAMVLEMTVDESPSGRICAVSFGGPDLFRRWEEAGSNGEVIENQLLPDVDALLRSTIETRPGARNCTLTRAEHRPGRFGFECGELKVYVVASEQPGGDDEIRFSTASPCSSP